MRYLLLFVIFTAFAAQAQNQYFANDPVWNQTSACNTGGGPNGNCISTDAFNYRLIGDSLVAGETYSKVMRVGTVTSMWLGPPPALPGCGASDTYTPYLMGLVRQDGLRIWQWDGDMEQLLYDFDLEVGETLPLTLNNWNTDITVVAIDSFLVGTEWRKRFELANSWAQYLLEGIGSIHGLFEPISDFFDCGYTLNCFGLDMEVYYPELGTPCDLVLAMISETGVNTGIQVFPIPAVDHVVVAMSDADHFAVVRLIDLQGRELLRDRMKGSRTVFDVSGIPDGVYILIVGDQQRRLVVAH